jgi:hypothetical protein
MILEISKHLKAREDIQSLVKYIRWYHSSNQPFPDSDDATVKRIVKLQTKVIREPLVNIAVYITKRNKIAMEKLHGEFKC